MMLSLGDINTLASQIQKIEGYYPPGTPGYPSGSLAWQNNNPGNLVFNNQRGATKSCASNGYCYAKFDSYNDGQAALYAQIQGQASKGQNLQQFIWQYAPPCPKAGQFPDANGICPDGTRGNNTDAYLAQLTNATGATPDTALLNVIGTSPGVSLPPTIPGTSINTSGDAITPDYFPSGDPASDSESFWGSSASSGESSTSALLLTGIAGVAAFYLFTR